jgi:hypothetical protein
MRAKALLSPFSKTGHFAAPPRSAMNSRRRTFSASLSPQAALAPAKMGASRRSCSPRRRMSAPPEAAPLLAPCHKYTSGCEVVARPARQLSGARSGNSCPRRDDWQLCVANHRNDPCGGNDPKSPAVMPPTTPIKSVASPRIRPVRSVSARPRPIKRSWIVRHDRDCWRPVTERWARCILVHRRWGVCVDVRRWAAIGGRRWW